MRIIWYFIVCLFLFFIAVKCNKENNNSSIARPVAAFSISKPVFKIGDTVQFINTSLNASSYLWDFADGSSSTEISPGHLYTNSGTYRVSLTATNEAGSNAFYKDLFIKDITVMTYNIAFSGGAVEYLYDMWQKDGHGAWNHDRRPELIKIIRSVNPDILGLQEAFSWYEDVPKIYERFADSIGMKYYYFPEFAEAEWNGICIYSKFPIQSTSFLLHQPCTPNQLVNGTFMVQAAVQINDEILLDVFVCHFISQAKNVHKSTNCEVKALYSTLIDDFKSYTILMGDFNYAAQPEFTEFFYFAGLTRRYEETIDQIWASEILIKKSRTYGYNNIYLILDPYIFDLLSAASDHRPTVAYFAF